MEEDDQTFDERSGEMFNGPPAQIPDWVGTAEAAPPSLVDAPGVNPQNAPSNPAYQDAIPPDQMARFNRLGEESDQIEAQRRIDARKGIEEYTKGIQGLQDIPTPQLEQSPQPPQAQLGKGLQEYMMVVTALAGLAGGFARGNATVALTAFAAGVKGFTQGKMQEFEAKSEEWKEANAKVINDNKTKLDRYDMIFKDKKLSVDAKLSAIKMVAAEHQDEIMYNLAQQKEIVAMGQLQMKQTQLQAQLEATSIRLASGQASLMDHLQKSQDTRDAADQIAQGIEDGTIPPDQMGSYGSKSLVLGKLARDKVDVKKMQLEWGAAKKQIQSLYGPQLTRFKALAVSVDNTIDEVKYYADQLKQGGYPLINDARIAKNLNINSNSPQGQLTSKYITAVNTLKEEFAGLANGGYAPTEAVWNLANQQINANYGGPQLNASLSEVQRLIRYRMSAFEQLDPLHTPIGRGPGTQAPGGAPGNDGWGNLEVH